MSKTLMMCILAVEDDEIMTRTMMRENSCDWTKNNSDEKLIIFF